MTIEGQGGKETSLTQREIRMPRMYSVPVLGNWSQVKEMKDENGILVFDKGDQLPELPHGLNADVEMSSVYGFKIVEKNGEYSWEMASEADYRKAEATRLGIREEDVEVNGKACVNSTPTTCSGSCVYGVCKLAYSPTGGYYYCFCSTSP